MSERKLVVGGFYRHFKDKLYQVKCVAYHSETKEKMVVYQALYGDFSVYVRPYDMFMSEVDRNKYPDVKQRYRFEQVFPGGQDTDGSVYGDTTDNENAETKTKEEVKPAAEEETRFSGDERADSQVDERLMRFLDAESYAGKLEVLSELRNNLDDKLIDAMAVSLDIEVLPGRPEERYASLRKCIQAHAKYEGTRLRI